LNLRAGRRIHFVQERLIDPGIGSEIAFIQPLTLNQFADAPGQSFHGLMPPLQLEVMLFTIGKCSRRGRLIPIPSDIDIFGQVTGDIRLLDLNQFQSRVAELRIVLKPVGPQAT